MIHMLTANPYHKTKNQRGYMHPLSSLTHRFVEFSVTARLPVMDMGCAYGNTVIAALEKGANMVIACDMAEEHLAVLQKSVSGTPYASRLITKQGVFPSDIYFEKASLAAVHTSHMLPYLTGAEVEQGLAHFFHWLAPGGRLFIVCYSRFIRELMNEHFQQEYARRLEQNIRWP
jgi:SAM-dependent methyltransferase